jgi:hypothetical protein
MAPGARVPVFGRCACCCWGTLLATRRCLGDCSRGGGPRADGQRQSNAAQREQSTAKQRPSTARLQSFYFAARLAAAPGVQASRAGSVRLPRTAAGTQPPPGKSSKRARLGQGVRAKFTQHSEAHANQRRHSRPGPSIMLWRRCSSRVSWWSYYGGSQCCHQRHQSTRLASCAHHQQRPPPRAGIMTSGR